jgi:RNA methyltransferase, TrmH family
MRNDETTICGLAAVRARFAHAPDSVVRLFFDLPTSKKVGDLCSAMAASRRVYRCVPPQELEKIAESVHHGGIVAVVRDEAPQHVTREVIEAWKSAGDNLVILDRIGNAHNLGAIARTAAYFGVPRLVIAGDASAARPGPAAYRVAEGGLEALTVSVVPVVAPFLRALAAAGYEVVGAATRGGVRLSSSRVRRPWALVLGNEEAGMSPSVENACTLRVTIPGSGKVESLNVSAAAAVLLAGLPSGSAR